MRPEIALFGMILTVWLVDAYSKSAPFVVPVGDNPDPMGMTAVQAPNMNHARMHAPFGGGPGIAKDRRHGSIAR